jgi:ATP-binding cassette subfamily B protein
MTFSSLLNQLTPHRGALSTILALLLLGSALSLAQPWLAGQLTAALLSTATALWTAQQILLVWLGLLLIRSLTGFASSYYVGSTGELMTAQMRSRLHQHIQMLPLVYFQQRRRGETLSLLSNDAEVISSFVSDTLVQLLPLALTFVGAFVMMATIDPLIASLAAALLPAYYLAMKLIGRRMRPLARRWIDAHSRLLSMISENLGLVPVIKAFRREPVESSRFEAHNQSLLSISRQQLLLSSIMAPAIGLLAGVGLLLLLWIGGQRIDSGTLQAPQLVSLLLYAMLMNQPLKGLADVYGSLQITRGCAERIQAFLSEQPEPEDQGLPDVGPVTGTIRFNKVSFHYPDGPPVLDSLNLVIAAGQTLAITGKNGAGKSSLMHLLMRFYDPQQGSITIDDVDIATVRISSLREQIGLVPQHVLLVDGTVADNIAYGCPLAVPDTIVRAATSAQAHDFILQLPQGYDTLIGEQGLRLSGGQRQRLSLARALLLDPPILVLDEATSMFDPAGEAAFIRDCMHVLDGKTVILISHGEASLAIADQIVQLG